VSDTRFRVLTPTTQAGGKEARPRDEDEKATRVGSLERDQPGFLPIETLRHR